MVKLDHQVVEIATVDVLQGITGAPDRMFCLLTCLEVLDVVDYIALDAWPDKPLLNSC